MSQKSLFSEVNGTSRTSYGSTRGRYPLVADRHGAVEHELEPGDNLAGLLEVAGGMERDVLLGVVKIFGTRLQ